jgi:hypothetical protein
MKIAAYFIFIANVLLIDVTQAKNEQINFILLNVLNVLTALKYVESESRAV